MSTAPNRSGTGPAFWRQRIGERLGKVAHVLPELAPWHPLRRASALFSDTTERYRLERERDVRLAFEHRASLEETIYTRVLDAWFVRRVMEHRGGMLEDALTALPCLSERQGRIQIRTWFRKRLADTSHSPRQHQALMRGLLLFPWVIDEKPRILTYLSATVQPGATPLAPQAAQLIVRAAERWEEPSNATLLRLRENLAPGISRLTPAATALRGIPDGTAAAIAHLVRLRETDPARFANLAQFWSILRWPLDIPLSPLLIPELASGLTDSSPMVRIASASVLFRHGALRRVVQSGWSQRPGEPVLRTPARQRFWCHWLSTIATQPGGAEIALPILRHFAASACLTLRWLASDVLDRHDAACLIARQWTGLWTHSLDYPILPGAFAESATPRGILAQIGVRPGARAKTEALLRTTGASFWDDSASVWPDHTSPGRAASEWISVLFNDETLWMDFLWEWRPGASARVGVGYFDAEDEVVARADALEALAIELREMAELLGFGYVAVTARSAARARRNKAPMTVLLRDMGIRSVQGKHIALQDLYHPSGIGLEVRPGYRVN